MKIAFVLTESAVITGNKNGIKSQALTWKRGLESLGNTVELVNNWGDYNWEEYDAIHIFGYGKSINVFVNRISQLNNKVYLSPIIDSNESPFLYKLASFLGCSILRMDNLNNALKKASKKVNGVLVRSEHEKKYVNYSLGVPLERIFKVPLSFALPIPFLDENIIEAKEPFCLHVSSIYQSRKNVVRLVQAAVKFKFNLKLVGDTGTPKEFEEIRRIIGTNKNIEVLGYVSKDELINLYIRAKVFALPSISEGVGIVGLDAAVYGCNVVVTKLGGPKEYYNNMAHIVDPFNVDEIGLAILSAMEDDSTQPSMGNYVVHKFSLMNSINALVRSYKSYTILLVAISLFN